MVELMLKDYERINAKNSRSCNPHSLRKYPDQPNNPITIEQKFLALLKQKYQNHLNEYATPKPMTQTTRSPNSWTNFTLPLLK